MKVQIGVCSSCGAQYRMPIDFPSTRAQCAKCAGTVQISAEPEEVEMQAEKPAAVEPPPPEQPLEQPLEEMPATPPESAPEPPAESVPEPPMADASDFPAPAEPSIDTEEGEAFEVIDLDEDDEFEIVTEEDGGASPFEPEEPSGVAFPAPELPPVEKSTPPPRSDKGSTLDNIMARKRSEATASRTAEDAKEEPVDKKQPKKSATLEKILARKRAEAAAKKKAAETPPPAAKAPASGGGTREKILARKRAEAAAKRKAASGSEEAAPARKPVLKASAAPEGKRKSRSPREAAEAAPPRRGAGTRRAAAGRARGRHAETGEEGEERPSRYAPKKQNNTGMLIASAGAAVVIVVVGLFIFSGDDKPEPEDNTPVVAQVTKPEPPPEPRNVEPDPPPVVEPDPEPKKPEKDPEPEGPKLSRTFDKDTLNGLAAVEFGSIPKVIKDSVDTLAEGMPSTWARNDAYEAFDANAQAAYACALNALVALAKEKFSGVITPEDEKAIDDLSYGTLELHNVLKKVSGLELDREKLGDEKYNSQGTAEDEKKLEEMIRFQNANLAHIAMWIEHWSKNGLADKKKWNLFARKNDGIAVRGGGRVEEPDEVPPDDFDGE